MENTDEVFEGFCKILLLYNKENERIQEYLTLLRKDRYKHRENKV